MALGAAFLLLLRLMLCGQGTIPVMGLILAQEALKQAMCLGAGLLGGAAARSDEAGDDLLRVTRLTAREIALAKLGAALARLWLPVGLVTAARIAILALTLSGGLVARCRVLILGLPVVALPQIAPRAMEALSDIGLAQLSVWLGHLYVLRESPALAPWAAYFLIQPALDAALFGAAGLAAGSRRRAGNRVAAGLVASVGLWIVGYLALRITTQWLALNVLRYANARPLVRLLPDFVAGRDVFFALLPLNLWTSGLPAVLPGMRLLPERLMLLIGGVVILKLGLIAGLARMAERGLGEGR
jgi:hypothetical protein